MKKFVSTNPRLEPYVNGEVCLFKDGEIDSWCVYKSSYRINPEKVDNSFDFSDGCVYTNVCDNDANRAAFNAWLQSFF